MQGKSHKGRKNEQKFNKASNRIILTNRKSISLRRATDVATYARKHDNCVATTDLNVRPSDSNVCASNRNANYCSNTHAQF